MLLSKVYIQLSVTAKKPLNEISVHKTIQYSGVKLVHYKQIFRFKTNLEIYAIYRDLEMKSYVYKKYLFLLLILHVH